MRKRPGTSPRTQAPTSPTGCAGSTAPLDFGLSCPRLAVVSGMVSLVAATANVESSGSKWGRGTHRKSTSMNVPTEADPIIRVPAIQLLGPPLLSLDELVEWTGIAKSTIYSLLSEGRGPRSAKIGRLLRFRADDIAAWLDGLVESRPA